MSCMPFLFGSQWSTDEILSVLFVHFYSPISYLGWNQSFCFLLRKNEIWINLIIECFFNILIFLLFIEINEIDMKSRFKVLFMLGMHAATCDRVVIFFLIYIIVKLYRGSHKKEKRERFNSKLLEGYNCGAD